MEYLPPDETFAPECLCSIDSFRILIQSCISTVSDLVRSLVLFHISYAINVLDKSISAQDHIFKMLWPDHNLIVAIFLVALHLVVVPGQCQSKSESFTDSVGASHSIDKVFLPFRISRPVQSILVTALSFLMKSLAAFVTLIVGFSVLTFSRNADHS